MKVSLNWVKEYLDFDLPPVDELVEKIGAQLGGVDEVIDLGAKYKDIIIAKVASCEPHPQADRLKVCKIDDGGKVRDIERDESGHIVVVCGAQNVEAGQMVAWIPPGSTVPSTVDSEPFVLGAREIRGVVSNGMLASPKELSISDSHEGLLILEPDNINPGANFAEAYKLNDHIIDIENKMFTHRPDLFGQLGIAREIAGILGHRFNSPAIYKEPKTTDPAVESDRLKLVNELPELVPRFILQIFDNVKVGPSPVWLQTHLSRVGLRPINNIVDITNYFMLLTGQPLHAYDYDKVKALSGDKATITIRCPAEGEKVKLLNGKEIEPRREAIMIATDKQLIGIGGVMGGSETEVDHNTRCIVLECGTFDMYSIRRTSMEHGLFTDAATRFTKGQSPLQNDRVVAMAAGQLAGDTGVMPAEMLDGNNFNKNSVHESVVISVEFINVRLGLKLTAEEIAKLLTNVEFIVEVSGNELKVTAPFWRTDIELPEDIVEEVGRLYGYDKLPLELPERKIIPTKRDEMFDLKARIRNTLSRAGANEVLTYSFVHGNLLDKAGQDKAKAFQVANALSPDLQYFRLSLTPSLLDKVHANIKAGHDKFALFEIGKAHLYGQQDHNDPTIPKEGNSLALVYANKNESPSAPYYLARKQLVNLLADFDTQHFVEFEPLDGADLYGNVWVEQTCAPYEPKRSAVLRDKEGLIWGVVGEFRPSVRQALKLSKTAAGFEIDPLLLFRTSGHSGYVPLPRFPAVTQDITLKVPADLNYHQVYDFVWRKLGEVQPDNTLPLLSPINIYQPETGGSKHFTFRLKLASYERTLTDSEVNNLLDEVAAGAKEKLNAERV